MSDLLNMGHTILPHTHTQINTSLDEMMMITYSARLVIFAIFYLLIKELQDERGNKTDKLDDEKQNPITVR